MGKQLTLVSLFEGVPGGCPAELQPFLKCSACGHPFYIINASLMDWSNNEMLPGNTFIEMDMHCECPDPKPLPDTEKGLQVSFDIGGITITEVRSRWVETRPYRTIVERSKVVANVKVENWDRIRHKISNFLLLPLGFEAF